MEKHRKEDGETAAEKVVSVLNRIEEQNNSNLADLPRETQLEICNNIKRETFRIGDPIPLVDLLQTILTELKIDVANLAWILGLKGLLLQDLFLCEEDEPYPYEELFTNHIDDIVIMMTALNFTVFEWKICPRSKPYHDDLYPEALEANPDVFEPSCPKPGQMTEQQFFTALLETLKEKVKPELIGC